MNELDLIIRNATLVTQQGERQVDVGIAEGKIAQLEPVQSLHAGEVVEATGLHVFPGLIDSHVHFNDPGRAHWEGIETGSRALAAGGGTMFFDMPMNASPPTLDGPSFDAKLAIASRISTTDFAVWGGLTPLNLDRLEELAGRGVIGFKAFMANSGMADFPCVDDATLREGMKRAARLGRLVAVHAESEAITAELTQLALSEDRVSTRDFLASRPERAELEAIRRATDLAGETGCALHIVHVSTGSGARLVAEARARGVDVTCETCPHYLLLTDEDMEKLGAVAKCAPPLRARSVQEDLWSCITQGLVTTVGSDHSPSPPEMKHSASFFKIWGGISSVQHTLPLLLDAAVSHRLELPAIAALTSLNVAERFGLPKTKGRIAPGADADLTLVDLGAQFTVKAEDLHYRHRLTPYVGRALTGRVVRTILRGQTICQDGRIVSPPLGRLVKPIT